MKETRFRGVFDSPLADYERVFRPFLPPGGLREMVLSVPTEGRHLVIDLISSGYNLVELSDIADCAAVGRQLSDKMTVEELAHFSVTYLHSDLSEFRAWNEVDQWRREVAGDDGAISLALARPEGAFYSSFWDFENYWRLMVEPALARLRVGGYLVFQTPFRCFIGEGKNHTDNSFRWNLNQRYRTNEIEQLEIFTLGLNASGFEARLEVADLRAISRPYFDICLMAKRVD